MAAEEEFLTTGGVAQLLHVSPKTVNRWAHQGLLPATRTLGGHLRFRRSDAERLREQMLAMFERVK